MATVTTMRAADNPTTAYDVSTPEPAGTPRVLKVRATYHLSQAARKAALLAGWDGRERQRKRVAVPSHRLHLVTVDANGVPHLKLLPRYELRGERVVRIDALPVFDHPPTSDELLLVAAKNHELEQKWHAQRTSKNVELSEARTRRDEIAKAFLADPRQRAMQHPAPSKAWCYLMTAEGRMLFDVTKGSPVSRRVPPEAHRRFEADLRARRRDNQLKRAAQEAVRDEKKRVVQDWIVAHGTSEQQARHRAGVLPMPEAIEAMTDRAFAAAAEFPLYRHDGASALQQHLRSSPEFANAVVVPADLVHTFEDAKQITAGPWARAQALQRLLPNATVAVRFHRLSWRTAPQAPSLTRYGIVVVQSLGPFTLRREYDAGDEG